MRNYGMNAFFGSLQVSYREALRSIVDHEHMIEDKLDKTRNQSFYLHLRISPAGDY